jgi:hypothetical protein
VIAGEFALQHVDPTNVVGDVIGPVIFLSHRPRARARGLYGKRKRLSGIKARGASRGTATVRTAGPAYCRTSTLEPGPRMSVSSARSRAERMRLAGAASSGTSAGSSAASIVRPSERMTPERRGGLRTTGSSCGIARDFPQGDTESDAPETSQEAAAGRVGPSSSDRNGYYESRSGHQWRISDANLHSRH